MSYRARNCLAFTLIELLIAVAITVLMSAIMVRVTAQVLEIWQQTQNRHAQLVAAKQVLDTIERDLQTLVWRRDATRYFAAEILDSPAALNYHGWLLTALGPIKPADGGSLRPLPDNDPLAGEPLIRDARFGLSGVWLRFVAFHTDSTDGTLPVVISYRVVRRPVTGLTVETNPAPRRYGLFRSAVTATDTFSFGYDVKNIAYASSDNSPSILNRSPSNVTNPHSANLIASNVVDFGCWLYRKNSDGTLERIFPGNAQDVSHLASGDSVIDATRMPDVVDVVLRILTDQGATIVDAIEAGRLLRPPEFSDDATWWWSVVDQNSVIVGRRIEITARAL